MKDKNIVLDWTVIETLTTTTSSASATTRFFFN